MHDSFILNFTSREPSKLIAYKYWWPAASTSSADNPSSDPSNRSSSKVIRNNRVMEEVNIHSAASEKAGDISSFCASCGIAKGDVLKLMTCTACKLVRYCSVACQKHHRPQHKQACKKRMAELRDDLLFTFTQPESSCYGDCPICCLPMPIDTSDFSVMSCCCKSICDGCFYADMPRQLFGSQKQAVCLYCRHPLPETQAEFDKNKARRAEANDPAALRAMGHIYYLKKEHIPRRLITGQSQLVWEMRYHISNYLLCFGRVKAWRRMRKRESSIWRRLLSLATLIVDTILGLSSGTTETSKGLWSISSSPLHSAKRTQCKFWRKAMSGE